MALLGELAKDRVEMTGQLPGLALSFDLAATLQVPQLGSKRT